MQPLLGMTSLIFSKAVWLIDDEVLNNVVYSPAWSSRILFQSADLMNEHQLHAMFAAQKL